MPELRAVLDAIGTLPDRELDLANAALHLARVDAPDADWHSAQLHLSEIARRAAAAAQTSPNADLTSRAAALRRILFDGFGYRGDSETYDDLANANLLRVIERRRGLPVALGILWLHAAMAAGWAAYGIDLPGHFVIALKGLGEARIVLDVFEGGTILSDADLRRIVGNVRWRTEKQIALRRMSRRAVLLRLQANIRLRRQEAGDLAGALACLQSTLAVAPNEALLWGEAGALQQRLDRPREALARTNAASRSPPGAEVEYIRATMDALRTKLN